VEVFGLAIGLFLIILGLVLLGIELAHPGVFLLIPATAILVAGSIYIFAPDILLNTLWGPVAISIAAFAAAFGTIPYYKRIAPIHRPMSTTSGSLQGEIGLVISEVIPDSLRGKVQFQSEIWSARSEQPIPVGTKVRVVRGEGVSVWVVPLGTVGGAP
jgi:membrane-bound ClpP family serine protease